jgi:hypothetical protein
MMRLEDTTKPTWHQEADGSESFSFFMPVERLEKSDKDGKRYVQGVASTDERDLQGEVVRQGGIDYSYFLKYGYINDDHKDGPEHKVGEPTECRLTPAGLWMKGFLYKGKERAEYWWEHINTLAQNTSQRKVGFSIQGKVLRREGNTIAKCWLQDVAITASPVNTSTWAEIVKSLSKEKWCLHPWQNVCEGGCCTCGPAIKSITAAEESEEEKKKRKALSAGGMGRVLIPQSLEGRAKLQTHKSNRISYREAVEAIRSGRKCSIPVAKALADAIFATAGTQ